MGYWYTQPGGASMFAPLGAHNPDGTAMRWGDGPSDELCAGMAALIERLRRELGRYPSIAEIDAQKTTAWEMRRALRDAAKAFRDDLGRPPTPGEIQAGLDFAAAAFALDSVVSDDISAGDTVLLCAPGRDGASGVVESIELCDGDRGAIEVLVAVRTPDGGNHLLERRYIRVAEGGTQ